MAATLVGATVFQWGTTAGQPTAPAGVASNDTAYYLWISKRPSAGTPATPEGWSLVTNYVANAGGTETGNQGPMRHMIWKQLVSGSLTLPSIANFTGTGQVTATSCAVYRPGVGETISEFQFNGDDLNETNPRSIVFTAPGVQSGDQLLLLSSNADNSTLIDTPSLSGAGATFGAVTERDDSNSGNGDDMAAYLHTAAVTAGPSTANVTFSANLSAQTALSSVGGTTLLVVRSSALAAASSGLFLPF